MKGTDERRSTRSRKRKMVKSGRERRDDSAKFAVHSWNQAERYTAFEEKTRCGRET